MGNALTATSSYYSFGECVGPKGDKHVQLVLIMALLTQWSIVQPYRACLFEICDLLGILHMDRLNLAIECERCLVEIV